MAAVNDLQGSRGLGYGLDVGPDGGGRTQPGDAAILIHNVTVGQASTVLVEELEGRRAIEIQNQHDTAILYVRLENSPASTSDVAVYPRETYRFPSGVTYTGVIMAYSSALPPMSVVVVEYYLVPDAGTM